MKPLLKAYIEDNADINYNNEVFNYNFNSKSTKKEFKIEYEKFLNLCRLVFYSDDRLVTAINSNEIRFKSEVINHLFNMCIYAKNNNLNKEKMILLEFLYTYFNTINSKIYKKNCADHKEAKQDFIDQLNNVQINTKKFLEYAQENNYKLYKSLIQFGIKRNIFLDSELINRIFNNLKKQEKQYNELIDLLVKNKISLYDIILYDKNKKEHRQIYIEYILESLSNFRGYNYAKEMIFELDKENCLVENDLKNIINKYIDNVNELCNKLKDKKESFLGSISEIEMLRSELLYILQHITNLSDKQKHKLKECLIQLLRLKRYLLSDEDYVNAEMHKQEFKVKMSSEKIEKYKQELLNNKYSLYNASKINFSLNMENALESYAKFPLQSIVTRFSIDTSSQVYMLSNDKNISETNNFKKYYDKIGKDYTDSHPKLQNKLNKDYYEELLNYLSKTFPLNQALIMNMLGYDNFKKIIYELNAEISPDLDNDYAIIVNNILAMELHIQEVLKRNNLSVSNDDFTNLNNLFNCYDDNYSKNGLMYLNYILYDKNGLDLRNKMLHGSLINSDLNVPLLVSFSGLIFTSVMINEV